MKTSREVFWVLIPLGNAYRLDFQVKHILTSDPLCIRRHLAAATKPHSALEPFTEFSTDSSALSNLKSNVFENVRRKMQMLHFVPLAPLLYKFAHFSESEFQNFSPNSLRESSGIILEILFKIAVVWILNILQRLKL